MSAHGMTRLRCVGLVRAAGQTQCWIELGEPWRWQIYMSLVAAALFVCPAVIIAACYAIIIRTIWANGAILVDNGNNKSAFDFVCVCFGRCDLSRSPTQIEN